MALTQLHAAGLVCGIWVPPAPVRDLCALITQRSKLRRLATQARDRRHAALHRARIVPPAGNLFGLAQRVWWHQLPVSPLEQVRMQTDLATLSVAEAQIASVDQALTSAAAADDRLPLLVQLPGVHVVSAMTILAAFGEITRFPSARHLVGYAGLGARVHSSGQTHHSGRITKAGRRDLRHIMAEAAQTASRFHPYWGEELAQLEPRIGRNKAIVAIAHTLLVSVWHGLTDQTADCHSDAVRIARALMVYGYRLGRGRRPAGQSVHAYVRAQLTRLGIGEELTTLVKGPSTVLKLPAADRSRPSG